MILALAPLAANAEVLLAHPEPTVELYRQGLERSRVAAERFRTLIDELLIDARGRARTIDRRPVDLVALVRSVADEVDPQNITLSVTGPSSAVCSVDETSVRRAVHNLVDNAVRYAPDGSTVLVGVEVDRAGAAVVATDHGPGIPASEQGRVFERFWRGRPDVPGTVLGLAIARQVAAAHGGHLTVASPGPTGDGCVFRLTVRRRPGG